MIKKNKLKNSFDFLTVTIYHLKESNTVVNKAIKQTPCTTSFLFIVFHKAHRFLLNEQQM